MHTGRDAPAVTKSRYLPASGSSPRHHLPAATSANALTHRHWGRLEPDEEDRTRLRATTDEPDWYARQLAAIPAPFRVIGSPELKRATAALGQRLVRAAAIEVPT